MPDPESAKREAILAAALTLFVRNGFEGAPTSAISKEAGVATGTLFFYFRTKEELVDTLYLGIKEEAAAAMCLGVDDESGVRAKLRRVWINGVRWGTAYPEKLRFMEQFARSGYVSQSAHEAGMAHFVFLQDLVQEGIREGVIRDSDPQLLFCMMAAALSGLISRVTSLDNPHKRDEIMRQGLELVWGGVGK
jgi:AcrR family transcriptional regulator